MRDNGFADLEGISINDLIPSNDELFKVINNFSKNGFGAWIVGGAVRDCLLGQIPSEFDLCTTATPEQVKSIFDETIPTGEKYGTITVKSGESLFEVTTLRTEMDYGDGRRPEIVNWGSSLSVDLSRRDFTINSMAYDLERELLFDPYSGVSDLKMGVLKAVGDAHERLAEDGLRIMRAYRFMDRGNSGIWEPDYALSTALIDNRSMLSLVSVERIWMEFSRIILGENATHILKRMNQDGILFSILQEPIGGELISKLTEVSCDLESRLALLFSNTKSTKLEEILNRLKISNYTTKRTILLHSIIGKSPDLGDVRLYRKVIGRDVNSHLELHRALGYSYENIEKSIQHPIDIKPIVDGNWIMKRTGLQPGVKLGKLKDWLYRIQIERGHSSIDEVESILCTLPWDVGVESEWPGLTWP